jgi:uncharacterized protein (TIGR02246 family)
MTTVAVKDSLALINEVGQAWNARDIPRILTLFTEDGVWEASWGARYVGKAELKRGLEELFKNVPDVKFVEAKRFASDDHGVSEWRVVGTRPDGTKIDDQGCDLYTIRDGKVASKRAYRKSPMWTRPA